MSCSLPFLVAKFSTLRLIKQINDDDDDDDDDTINAANTVDVGYTEYKCRYN